MPKIAFTDATVRSLSPGMYFDTKTPAFGLRVGKNKRTWLVLRGAKSDKFRLGHYPDCSLADARKKAFAALGNPVLGVKSVPFPEARDTFLKVHGATLRPGSYYQLQRTIKRHFHWTKKLDKITHTDVSAAIEAIEAPSEAAHAFKDIRTFFNWCVPKYLSHSPCTGLRTPSKYVPRDRLLTEDEVTKIWHASLKLGDYGLQLRRLIATGQRTNQIFSLVPGWVNKDQQLLQFPASVMKGAIAHDYPYGELTKTLLDTYPRLSNPNRTKPDLHKLCGFSNFTHHDFRRFYSSTMAKLKVPIDITEALLSHVSGSRSPIQRVYDLYDRLPERQEATGRYEAYLLKLFAR